MNVSLIPIFLYLVVGSLLCFQQRGKTRWGLFTSFLVAATVCTHGYLLHHWIDTQYGQNLSIPNVFSFVIWLIFTLLFLLMLRGKPVTVLQLWVCPLAIFSLIAVSGWSHTYWIQAGHNRTELLHILLSLSAFGLLSLSGLQALLLASQQHYFRTRQSERLMRLPPLDTMELLLFQMIGLGFLLLTASLITGARVFDSSMGYPEIQKILFACVAWLVFAVLLFGHYRFGWRGQTAVRFTLAGFILLVVSYFGSRLFLALTLA